MPMEKGETPQAAIERLGRELAASKFLVQDLHHQLRLSENAAAALLGASQKRVGQLLERMNDLYSYLSLLRHRHIPRTTDDRLIRDIDAVLGKGEESLKEWWSERLTENEKKSLAQKGKTQA